MRRLSSIFVIPLIVAPFIGTSTALTAAGSGEFEAARQAGIQTVLDDPGAYGLYNEESIMDLNLGGIMLQARENAFDICFVLETSSDLSVWEVWEDFQRILPTEEGKLFLRIRAFVPPDVVSPNILIYEHWRFCRMPMVMRSTGSNLMLPERLRSATNPGPRFWLPTSRLFLREFQLLLKWESAGIC